jgi:nicotinamide phosphoribosyltransferase
MTWSDKVTERPAVSANRVLEFNPCLATDSYKATHARQYPKGTTKIYSYFESRGKPDSWSDEVVFFGLQYMLSRLVGSIVTKQHVQEAKEIWAMHFGNDELFNYDGWMHIVNSHGGKLPVSIKAIPEGTVVPTRNVLMTIENTDPRCFWLTNWLETYLVQAWYPSTVATQSREMKKILLQGLNLTGDPSGLPFKLHDFGFRGVTSYEQAGIGGAAHLVNFQGTDTMAGIVLARQFYEAKMPGYSIPASEHSTITSWGKENEVEAFRNMLDIYPKGLVACVSDSFDIIKACKLLWGGALKEKVLARDGTLVVRPDSGEPVETVLAVIEALGSAFGFTKNAKGFKVLPSQIRMIQGDGIDFETMKKVVENLANNGWSIDNIAFGSGGGLLQKVNRDTLQFAFKCSAIDGEYEGETFSREVFKDPITSSAKKSKHGRLALIRDNNGKFQTVSELVAQGRDELREVFRDGELLEKSTFDEIKTRAIL